MLGYEKIPDPNAPDAQRETPRCMPTSPTTWRCAAVWPRRGKFLPTVARRPSRLREGVVSNWGNRFTSKDVKWTWDRKFKREGQGLFQTAVLGLTSPDQIKIEGDHAISFNLDKPSPILLKQQCNLANPIYDGTKCAAVGASDDPWAINFLKNDSAGFGPYRLSQLVRGHPGGFRGALRLLGH